MKVEPLAERESAFMGKLYSKFGMSIGYVSGYSRTDKKCLLMCAKHGTFEAVPSNMVDSRAKVGCSVCKGERTSSQNKKPRYGVGINDSKDIVKNDYDYVIWNGMLKRVFCKKYHKKQPTYLDSSVCDEWLVFSKFKQDITKMKNYDKAVSRQGWVLDKDILVKGNKHYSPETCAFVPVEINSFFGGAVKAHSANKDLPLGVSLSKGNRKNPYYVMTSHTNNGECIKEYLGRYNNVVDAFKAYKVRKEEICKALAEKYKSELDELVYQAMLNYEVEITD